MARRKRYRAAIAQRLEAVEREIAESRAQGESSGTERRIASLQAEEAAAASLPRPPP